MSLLASGRNKRVVRKAPSLYYQPSRKIQKKDPFNWKLFWALARLFGPLLVIIYVLYFSPIFQIKEIIVSGNSYISSAEIVATIPKTNIFRVNTSSLESDLKTKIPSIKKIDIYKGIPDALKVVVTEYEGSLIWQSGSSYYLVSGNGTVFRDVTSNIADYVAYPRVNDLRSLPVNISDRLVSSVFIDFIKYIFDNVKSDANLDPDYFTIDATTVDVNLITKNNMYIKFDSLRSSEKQINDLKLVLVEKRPEITEYIDLRVNGWAYYK